jgi:hypothetical protein
MGSELESKCLSDNYEMGKRYDVFVTTPKEGKYSSTFMAIIDRETIKELLNLRFVQCTLHKMSRITVLELLNKQECKKFGPYIH